MLFVLQQNGIILALERMLTKWGYKDSLSTIDGSNSSFHSTEGSLGGMLPKRRSLSLTRVTHDYLGALLVFQRTLPHNCPCDNIYCLFPFVVPGESEAYIRRLRPSDVEKYTIDRPMQVKIKVLKTLKAITEVLNDHETFHSSHKLKLIGLTGGYG